MTATWIMLIVTAYCPCSICCGKHADGKTATGRDANLPGVSVDPKVIPYGSRVDVPGYTRGANGNGSWILADDTGGAMRQATKAGKVQIDIRFKTHQEALDWGRKTLRVRVWRKK